MKKAQVSVIIWIVVILILIFGFFLPFFSSFAEGTPELTALNDFKVAVEKVCAPGGPTAFSTPLYLPKLDESNYFKLHMAGGTAEVYKCSNLGSAGCSDSEKIKSKGLNCTSDILFDNCWIEAPQESLQITVLKNITTKTISLNKTTIGVYC